jgi:hypothetical protein
MSEPADPVVTSEPIAPPEVARAASHLTLWLEQHVAPELARVKADAARALAYAQAHAAQEEAIASLLVKIVSAADPAAAPVLAELVPEAERLLAAAERRVAEFAGPQM